MNGIGTGGNDVDLAVVGGGIIGCLVAREVLARSPGTSVAVIDRGLVGSGASSRSAGLHFPRGANARVRAMAAFSQLYYTDLAVTTPGLPIYPRAMSIVASAASDLHETYLDDAMLTRTDWLGSSGVTVPEGAGLWAAEGCHYADVGSLVGLLARELRPRARVLEGVQVTAVRPSAAGVRLGLSTGGSLAAGQVVLAPGPWLRQPAWWPLVEPLGARVKQVVALHVQRAPDARDPVIVFHDDDAFLLPMVHRGHWLYSFTSTRWDVDPDSIAPQLTRQALTEGLEQLRAHAPGLVAATTSGRVFCDAYTSTREPLVRALDEHRRVVFVGAANGSGYRLAPALAAQAADLIGLSSQQRIPA